MIRTAQQTPILWFGYSLFIIMLAVIPLTLATEALPLSSRRIGAADTFAIITTHSVMALSIYTVFWRESVAAVINVSSVRAMVFGAIVEAIGWVLQRSYWLPWYIGKELGYDDVVTFLNNEVWIISFAYILVWVGAGLTMNIVFRTVMGSHYQWWPYAWVMLILTSWIVGYQLPDVVRVIIG